MSSAPPPEFKSGQYEFNDEQNRQFSGLADSMVAFATLMKVLGLALGVLLGLHLAGTLKTSGHGPTIGLGAATLLCLAFGFFTGSASASFRKIVETKNADVWHLMNAVGQLQNMFGFLRFLIMAAIVAAAIGAALTAAALFTKDG
jgi:hypothetical protein